jgi:hypothetical protein
MGNYPSFLLRDTGEFGLILHFSHAITIWKLFPKHIEQENKSQGQFVTVSNLEFVELLQAE